MIATVVYAWSGDISNCFITGWVTPAGFFSLWRNTRGFRRKIPTQGDTCLHRNTRGFSGEIRVQGDTRFLCAVRTTLIVRYPCHIQMTPVVYRQAYRQQDNLKTVSDEDLSHVFANGRITLRL